MKNLLLNILLSILCMLPPYLIFDSSARADDWGCQVILCLSNPGGPTQYAQCRPPIQKLWSELAKGHSFPMCSGIGFRSSRPGYQPYSCDAGYRLSGSFGPQGQEATCISTSVQPVNRALCSFDRDSGTSNAASAMSPHWQRKAGRLQCVGYPIKRPNVRSRPHYIDVTIDGIGQQRVWY